jgi:hypothetical protein
VIRKVLLLAPPAGAVLLIACQRRDIARCVKIKQMSIGRGHPENVPADGSHAYPSPGKGAAEVLREVRLMGRLSA